MEFGEAPLDYLLGQRWGYEFSQYEAIACLALATYEWMLSFAEEVELVHKRRWTWFKALYLICRYYPLVGISFTIILWQKIYTREFCSHVARHQVLSMIWVQAFPYVVLFVRCYVFLNRRRWFLIFSITVMTVSLLNQVIPMLGESQLADNQFKFTGIYGCFFDWHGKDRKSRYMGIALLLPIAIDVVSTVAIIHHYWKNREVQSPLSKLFVQQAVLYFSMVLFLNILAGGFQLSRIMQLDGRACVMLVTLPNLLACRLILQLRGNAATPTPSEAGQQLSFIVRRDLHTDESAGPLYAF